MVGCGGGRVRRRYFNDGISTRGLRRLKARAGRTSAITKVSPMGQQLRARDFRGKFGYRCTLISRAIGMPLRSCGSVQPRKGQAWHNTTRT